MMVGWRSGRFLFELAGAGTGRYGFIIPITSDVGFVLNYALVTKSRCLVES